MIASLHLAALLKSEASPPPIGERDLDLPESLNRLFVRVYVEAMKKEGGGHNVYACGNKSSTSVANNIKPCIWRRRRAMKCQYQHALTKLSIGISNTFLTWICFLFQIPGGLGAMLAFGLLTSYAKVINSHRQSAARNAQARRRSEEPSE